jgi:hypothetical protein
MFQECIGGESSTYMHKLQQVRKRKKKRRKEKSKK